MDPSSLLKRYYEHDAVRSRIVEFLGGTFLDQATCAYVLGCATQSDGCDAPQLPTTLPQLLGQGCEVARSLWDRQSLIAHLDIEYVNFDFPGEAYLNPAHMFGVQRPVEHAIERRLLQWGIAPLHSLTGRGHHFVWSVSRSSAVFTDLAAIGRMPDTLQHKYAQAHPPCNRNIDADLGRAFAGLGLLMEFLGHTVLREAAPESTVPLQLTDVEIGRPRGCQKGREVIAVDISEYADPLHTRHIRVPFSAYLKPHYNRESLGDHVVQALPPLFEIPLFELSTEAAITVMRNADRVAELASRASNRIPEQSGGTAVLLSQYRGSSLLAFHEWFYQQPQHPPAQWPETYDRIAALPLPSCTRYILEHPNDLLLKPAGIQHVVRVLMSLGWHPRHIAGLIRSKYERDFGWGQRWLYRDAANRADWYTRVFAGLICTGRDALIDFNCVSNREKGYCFEPQCGHNLADYRDSLTARKDHERLGCGPFNRLFLPHEHL